MICGGKTERPSNKGCCCNRLLYLFWLRSHHPLMSSSSCQPIGYSRSEALPLPGSLSLPLYASYPGDYLSAIFTTFMINRTIACSYASNSGHPYPLSSLSSPSSSVFMFSHFSFDSVLHPEGRSPDTCISLLFSHNHSLSSSLSSLFSLSLSRLYHCRFRAADWPP